MEAAAPLQQAAGGGRLPGLPIGFRFRPTDEELLLYYLCRKALAWPLPADIIPVVDLARLHPWDLVPPGAADDEERFFFHLPATRRGGSATRAAATGVWRPSGKEKLVVSPRCKRGPVGAKQTFVFCHRGGKRTDWRMHEYRLLPGGLFLNGLAPPHVSAAAGAKDWVVCRIFKRATQGHGGRAREEDAAEEMEIPSSPSYSSCVTDDDSSNEEEGEQSSSGGQ